MGYFSNGTEGECYEEQYCSKCVHQIQKDGTGCAVWMAHFLHNYAECNNPDRILHMLIPRDQTGHNQQCAMFLESTKVHKGKMPAHLTEWAAKQGIVAIKP